MILGIIPARGRSKGIPHKNIKVIAGKPLIAYTIEAVLRSKIFDRIIVSTDSLKIKDISQKYGAEVPFLRPKYLVKDNTSIKKTNSHQKGLRKIFGAHKENGCG